MGPVEAQGHTHHQGHFPLLDNRNFQQVERWPVEGHHNHLVVPNNCWGEGHSWSVEGRLEAGRNWWGEGRSYSIEGHLKAARSYWWLDPSSMEGQIG
jgi:hypothetical protein